MTTKEVEQLIEKYEAMADALVNASEAGAILRLTAMLARLHLDK